MNKFFAHSSPTHSIHVDNDGHLQVYCPPKQEKTGTWGKEKKDFRNQPNAINSANRKRIEHKDFERTLHHRVDSRCHDYPLNFSTLLSGGKKTNEDFLSTGE
ncbi:unnamed protein product [Onchocerca ochengi]|uniref:Protein Wnt n=1 Tax=Onchocerca ochengi TaxID=42157 RepID=A0A182ESL5_ONCOC|nr:unnamed protein product [Onchocerca ochengi]